MSPACKEAGIALVGGETAEMPSVYAENDLDVVGFVTGVVDREKMLTGADIKAGDLSHMPSIRQLRPAHQRLFAGPQAGVRHRQTQDQ